MSQPYIRVLKLVNGDEIIAQIRDGAMQASEDENYTLDNLVFVTNPMRIISEYNSKNKTHSLYLADWIPSIADETLPVDKQKILTLGAPNKDLKEHYIDIVVMQKLVEDHYTDAEEQSPKEGDSKEETSGSTDLIEKLKKHKFNDDDMQ